MIVLRVITGLLQFIIVFSDVVALFPCKNVVNTATVLAIIMFFLIYLNSLLCFFELLKFVMDNSARNPETVAVYENV